CHAALQGRSAAIAPLNPQPTTRHPALLGRCAGIRRARPGGNSQFIRNISQWELSPFCHTSPTASTKTLKEAAPFHSHLRKRRVFMPRPSTGKVQTLHTVERAIAVLSTLAQNSREMGVTEIAATLNVYPSVVS